MTPNKIAHSIFVIFAFVMCVALSCFLSGCTPYWKDGPSNPSPTQAQDVQTTAPAPFFWTSYIVTGQVNIRSEPNTSSEAVGYLFAGATVQANCDRTDGFCEVPGGYVVAACLGVGEGKCQSK